MKGYTLLPILFFCMFLFSHLNLKAQTTDSRDPLQELENALQNQEPIEVLQPKFKMLIRPYPNPTSDVLNVAAFTDIPCEDACFLLQVFSEVGGKQYEKWDTLKNLPVEISVAGWVPGVYRLLVSNTYTDNTFVYTFVVL